MRFLILSVLSLVSLNSAPALASPQNDEANATRRPIHALLVTGGCCHDYDRQKLILTRGITARANVRWTVVHQGGTTTDTPIPLYNDPDWAKGFDVVVHNECFSDVKDLEFVDRILHPHRNGTPAILIHCAMHCYRTGDGRWFEFVGLQSPGHGPHYSYTADNLQPAHPIMRDFGPAFVAPKGELYHSVKVFDTATPLAQANRQQDGMPQVCVWTNDYRGTKVFGCTMGHYNETMAEPKYLDMMARAVLWATDRDIESHFTPSTETIDEQIKALISAPIADPQASPAGPQCCVEGNLAFEKTVTASSTQSGNAESHLTDGRLDTRWCADGGQSPEWVEVDLTTPQHVRNLRLHWERRQGSAYRYTIQASADREQWTTIVDESGNDDKNGVRSHAVDAPETRFLRTTFLGCNTGGWGSIWEFEASAGDLPELPGSAGNGTFTPAASISDVKAPQGFNVHLYAAPPEVNYPVCLTAAATGEVFVGVDEQGSLGKEPGRGKVLRCMDTDGDGTADQITEFARMDHPRGLIFDNGSLWVLHPPFLSVYHDTDGDGTADHSEILIEGISTDDVRKRGADHTTNGIRMGIDGWIYIAVGDFGMQNAVARDGSSLRMRGGGVVRVRPDGSELEVYSRGLRNIVDVAIDPFMNIFTRDNTNDGGGWDTRLSHIQQTAHYGYPSLYKHFSDEIMPTLADYGGGSGCGAMYFHDERWPAPFNQILLTCDWGRSEVFSHQLPVHGATFDAQQDTLLKIPRPTDIDADASGRVFVSSWKNGQFNYDGPNVGFVAMITPKDFVPRPIPEIASSDDLELVELLKHPSDVTRLHVQREILRRTQHNSLTDTLIELTDDASAPLDSRVAAIWTLKQTDGNAAHATLRTLAASSEPTIRAASLRALSDRTTQLEPFWPQLFLDSLADPDDRVKAAAVIGLGRAAGYALRQQCIVSEIDGQRSVAELTDQFAGPLLKLTDVPHVPVHNSEPRPSGTNAKAQSDTSADDWRLPHPERVLPHLAVQALVELNAVETCLKALDGPHRAGALWALRSMHQPTAIDGLFQVLSNSRDESLRRDIWTTLIRLYHREGEFTEDSPPWWGTRPDTTGPYYDRKTWSESQRIADAVKVALAEADQAMAEHIRMQLKRHVVNLKGISDNELHIKPELETVIQLPPIDPSNPNQIANMNVADVISTVVPLEGDPEAGRLLFQAQSCVNCHTVANGQQPKGPHLVDIGRRYPKHELLESILDPSRKIAQGFDTWTFVLKDGRVLTGFVVLESAGTISIRQTDGLSREFLQEDIEERVQQKISMMPKEVAGNLTVQQLADLTAYLQSLH